MPMNEFLASYAAPIVQCAFMFSVGACVGSLTNVLVYRLPRGLDVVAPPSACPACQTKLTWRENIPVLGWIALGGRCRFCKSRISPEYPLVEAFVGLMYVALFLLFYVIKPGTVWLGVDWGLIRPEWTYDGFGRTWPTFATLIVLASSLVAMTLVDAKTFTIPLVLTVVPTVMGLVVHPIHAWWIGSRPPNMLLRHADHEVWTLATFGHEGWRALGAGIGGMIGVALAALLVRFKVIKRPFADYEEWERKQLGEDRAGDAGSASVSAAGSPEPVAVVSAEPAIAAVEASGETLVTAESAGESPAVPPPLVIRTDDPDAPVGPAHEPNRAKRERVLVYLACIGAMGLAGAILAPALGGTALLGLIAGAMIGPVLAGMIVARLDPAVAKPDDAATDDATTPGADNGVGDPEMWLAYPHARREMIREIIYLGPAIALAILGAAIAGWLGGPWSIDPITGDAVAARQLPLWAVALGGSLMGYLIGGAVVWGVRIFGSLAFGKEAMGMGDVHLMAAVGACLGWIDATIAFFLAAFVGIYWVIASAARSGGRVERAMPYGPYLAVATMLVVLGKPVVERLLGVVLRAGGPIDLP